VSERPGAPSTARTRRCASHVMHNVGSAERCAACDAKSPDVGDFSSSHPARSSRATADARGETDARARFPSLRSPRARRSAAWPERNAASSARRSVNERPGAPSERTHPTFCSDVMHNVGSAERWVARDAKSPNTGDFASSHPARSSRGRRRRRRDRRPSLRSPRARRHAPASERIMSAKWATFSRNWSFSSVAGPRSPIVGRFWLSWTGWPWRLVRTSRSSSAGGLLETSVMRGSLLIRGFPGSLVGAIDLE
jgi:hypothetical protein